MKSATRTFLVLMAAALVAATCNTDRFSPSHPGGQCGGFQGIPCAAGQQCDLPAGQCEAADIFGECVVTPEACIQVFDPVCGCDGVTYGNDCERLAAGVQKAGDGECLSSAS